MHLGQSYRTSVLRGTRSFTLLRLGRQLGLGLCRQQSLIVESRNSYALIRQIEELQLDVHHLNNMVNPILPPAPAVEEDPNVFIAEDDGMEADAKDEPEDEEIEPFEDDHSDGVSDIDNDHPEE